VLTVVALPEPKEVSLREVSEEDKYIAEDKLSVSVDASHSKA